MNFDSCEVKETTFGAIKPFTRFFNESGDGFCKLDNYKCIEDYSFNPISITESTKIFVKLSIKLNHD